VRSTFCKMHKQEVYTHAHAISLGLVIQLNSTLLAYQEQNLILHDENSRYQEYTDTLNKTVDGLVAELSGVAETEKQLTEAIAEYELMHQYLEAEILILTNRTGDLNETVHELNSIMEVFEEENNQFRELNQALGTIVTFLEVEANDVQMSYDELAKQLADTILRKEVLAEIGLKERMKADLAGWECGFSIAFGSQNFAKDEKVPIGYSSYDTVMNYISDKLLSDLCIVRGNLEVFLKSEVLPGSSNLWDINMKDLAFGLDIYSSRVLDHYFPNENEDGLAKSDWNAADYECINLSLADRYLYSASRI